MGLLNYKSVCMYTLTVSVDTVMPSSRPISNHLERAPFVILLTSFRLSVSEVVSELVINLHTLWKFSV